MIRVFDLRSPPYPPRARDYVIAPFPAMLRALQPIERCLIIDAPTAAAFAIERIDMLSTPELYELTGRATMPDGTPARAVRIGLRRLPAGELAARHVPFRGQLVTEVDNTGMEKDLRSICADGFAEARAEAAHLKRAPISVELRPDPLPVATDAPLPPPASAPAAEANGKPAN